MFVQIYMLVFFLEESSSSENCSYLGLKIIQRRILLENTTSKSKYTSKGIEFKIKKKILSAAKVLKISTFLLYCYILHYSIIVTNALKFK